MEIKIKIDNRMYDECLGLTPLAIIYRFAEEGYENFFANKKMPDSYNSKKLVEILIKRLKKEIEIYAIDIAANILEDNNMPDARKILESHFGSFDDINFEIGSRKIEEDHNGSGS